MVRSSPRVARTTAGLSFAVLRSVNGNLTSTTSPGWAVVGIEVWFVQPLPEPRLAQPYPLSDLKPLGHSLENDLQLLRRKVAKQFCQLFGRHLNRHPGHTNFLLEQESIRGGERKTHKARHPPGRLSLPTPRCCSTVEALS